MKNIVLFVLILCMLSINGCFNTVNSQDLNKEFVFLKKEASTLGKTEWRSMLLYMANLHEKGTHPAQSPFQFEWEELGPGYHARAFGHWDIVHIVLDVLPSMPIHSKHQLLNNIENQEESGLIPGSIYLDRPWKEEQERYIPYWNKKVGHHGSSI
ncbi:hypothetical protein ACFLSA_06760 [Bacteroidota bacterium]